MLSRGRVRVIFERSSWLLCGGCWFWVRWGWGRGRETSEEAGTGSRRERKVAWTKALAVGTEKA